MYCTGCGQSLVDNQAFCPQCGRSANAPNVSLPAEQAPPTTGFKRKVRALGFCWLAYSALVVAYLAVIVYKTGGDISISGLPGIGEILFNLIVLDALLGIAAAIGLLNFQGWGRVLSIISSVLAVPCFPFGTAIGIWGLVLLVSSKNAAAYKAL